MIKNTLTICVPILEPKTVPYGPVVINGILKSAGYNARVWDLNINIYKHFESQWEDIVNMFGIRGYVNPLVSKTLLKNVLQFTKTQLRKLINVNKPDAVLLSVFSSQSLDFTILLSEIVRKLLPDTYIIIGGRGIDNNERHSNFEYSKLFSNYLPADCVYVGDAENKLLYALENRVQGIFYAPLVNSEELELLPPADWTGIEFQNYNSYNNHTLRIPIIGSKGCVRKCTFCDVGASWPKYVYRKGYSIANEMIELYKNTGINKFEFTDNLINGSITNFREMNAVLAETQPDTLDYIGYAICRPQNEFPASDFKLAKTAGAKMFKVGIESGSEAVRHDMKKKFTNEDIDWFANNCYDNGIKQQWLMFCGYPTEKEEDFQQTLDLLEKYKHLSSNGMIFITLTLPMQLTSGSSFMRNYQAEYGLEHNVHDQMSDFFWTSTYHTKNTFDVRVERWKRFVGKIYECGYSIGTRQAEKLKEISGLENLYNEQYSKQPKKIIPINSSQIYSNKESYF